MAEWNYGDAYLRHPIAPGQEAVFDNGGRLRVHNLFDPLPAIMRDADLIVVDPPWNKSNLTAFYTKAGRSDYQEFDAFRQRLLACIREIAAPTCYIEMGKDYLGEFLVALKAFYPSVTFYNSSYYHKASNLCYIIRAAQKRRALPLDGMDEEDCIEWICQHEDATCIGDPCMGLGLVAQAAYRHHKRFVGSEINPKRLSAAIERVVACGATYTLRCIGTEEDHDA